MSTNLTTLIMKILFLIAALLLFYNNAPSQQFMRITDMSNPVVSDPVPSGTYHGAAWIDFDNDGLLDLFAARIGLYKNLGNGNFTKITTAVFPPEAQGTTWADFDNDGLIDCYVVSTSAPKSFLYKNSGNGIFTKINSGVIGDSSFNTGWGCAFGDYDNNGYVDLVIAAATPFGIVNHPSRFYKNNSGVFERLSSFEFTNVSAAYTIPSFEDFDLDGDVDLFIGSGPANNIGARDYLYYNTLFPGGTANFSRIDTGILGTDIVDGQNWNWIDIDNDGDLDGFLTNYSAGIRNRLYLNKGNGYYTKATQSEVGTIVTETSPYLSNNWGDFDNDGDLDVFLTTDGGVQNKYFVNNGNGFFTRDDGAGLNGGFVSTYGATVGDYDNDGDLDIFTHGTLASKNLYKNTIINSNKWINLKCIGVTSNKSAIGTRVRVKVNLNGTGKWLTRTINSQNGFNSMNMLNVHFGIGISNVIDSMEIYWTSGLKQTFINITPDKFYTITEGQNPVVNIKSQGELIPHEFELHQNYPNPFNPVTNISFHINFKSQVQLVIYDVTGKLIDTPVNSVLSPGLYSVNWEAKNLPTGTYLYSLNTDNYSETKKMLLIK